MFHLLYAPAAGTPPDDTHWADRAAAANLSVTDLRARAAPGRLVFLARGATRAPLEERAAALRRLGDGALVLDEGEFQRARLPRLVRAVRETPSGLALLDVADCPVATIPVGVPAQLIAAGLGGGGSARSFSISGLLRPGATSRESPAFRLNRLLARGHANLALDLTWSGASDRYRFRGGRFRFASLGPAAGSSAARNWQLLIDRFAAASALRLDLDFGRATPPPRGLMVISDATGGGWDHPGSDTESEFEHYCRWVQAAWAGGLWPEGAPRAVASHPGASPSVAPPPSTPPARLLPFSPRSPLEQAVDRLWVWGPPALLLPLFVILCGAGMLLLTGFGTPTLFLIVASLVSALAACVHAATLFGRRRRIEDLPTSRIRSAALGPIEVAGTTEALHPLCTPFSLLPCVYYEFHVVIETPAQAMTGTDGQAALLLFLRRGERGGRGREYTGRSGAIPFSVRDATGAVEVDPEGARMDVAHTQVLHNPPLASGLAAAGETVIVTERYIPVGYPVHITGELWSRPYQDPLPQGRESRPVLARPASGGSFVISERSEREQVNLLTRQLLVTLCVALLALMTGAAALAHLAGG